MRRHHSARRCAILALALGATVVCGAATPRPNLVLVLADDVGWTGLGCFGSDFYETPNLDRLAAQGVRFDCGFAPMTNCAPSRASLMSGQYTARHHLFTVGNFQDKVKQREGNLRRFKLLQPPNATGLSNDTLTLAESLRRAGYATGMFGKWHLGRGDQHPSRRGFEEAIESSGKHFGFTTDPPVEHDPAQYLSDFQCDHALAFMRRAVAAGKPFFLYLPDFLVHKPLEAKPDYLKHFESKPPGRRHHSPVAAAMTKSLDDTVGRLMAELDRLGVADNTLFVFTSDNGGLAYEEDGLRERNTSNLPLRGRKGSEFDGGLRVPYIFRWPGHIPAGTVCHEPIHGVDLYPTFLNLAGAPNPPQPLDGVDLRVCLENPDRKLEPRELYWYLPFYSSFNRPCVVVRRGDWKLIHLLETDTDELYNTADDLGEKNNLAASNQGLTRDLRTCALQWLDDTGAPRMQPNPEYRP